GRPQGPGRQFRPAHLGGRLFAEPEGFAPGPRPCAPRRAGETSPRRAKDQAARARSSESAHVRAKQGQATRVGQSRGSASPKQLQSAREAPAASGAPEGRRRQGRPEASPRRAETEPDTATKAC